MNIAAEDLRKTQSEFKDTKNSKGSPYQYHSDLGSKKFLHLQHPEPFHVKPAQQSVGGGDSYSVGRGGPSSFPAFSLGPKPVPTDQNSTSADPNKPQQQQQAEPAKSKSEQVMRHFQELLGVVVKELTSVKEKSHEQSHKYNDTMQTVESKLGLMLQQQQTAA